jgi:hypothetical protein
VTEGGGVLGKDLGESGAIRNCVITGNTAYLGAGIQLVGSSPVILNNWIEGNVAWEGGGIASWLPQSRSLIANNVITDNEANFGGGIAQHFGASSLIVNNTIYANTALEDGGGVYIREAARPVVANNLIVLNRAGQAGGGWFSCFGSLGSSIRNNYWANTPDDFIACAQAIRINDMSVDPLLADPPAGDFRLSAGSPSIDVGDRLYSSQLEADLDGRKRVRDGDGDAQAILDQGAYEYFGPVDYAPRVVSTVKGRLLEGGEQELADSDDRYVVHASAVDPLLPGRAVLVWLETSFQLAEPRLERLDVRVESRVTAAQITQELSLRKTDGAWVVVDSRPAQTRDTATLLADLPEPDQYVDRDGAVHLRVVLYTGRPTVLFQSYVDQASIGATYAD